MTFTRVPNGSFLCAAVRPSGRNGSPLAVPDPALYWVAFIEPLRQMPWIDAAKTMPPNQVETSNIGTVSMSLIDVIYFLLRHPTWQTRAPTQAAEQIEAPTEVGASLSVFLVIWR